MSVAPILGLRRAIVAHLRADSTVTSGAVSTRIYGERAPKPVDQVWPFVRYGQSDAVPGFRITAPIHVFSKAHFSDEAAEIAETIGTSLDGKVLTLDDGRKARLRYAGHQMLPDAAESSAWHAIVRIDANVVRDCLA